VHNPGKAVLPFRDIISRKLRVRAGLCGFGLQHLPQTAPSARRAAAESRRGRVVGADGATIAIQMRTAVREPAITRNNIAEMSKTAFPRAESCLRLFRVCTFISVFCLFPLWFFLRVFLSPYIRARVYLTPWCLFRIFPPITLSA
jgi:hypothetical protein